MRRSAWKWLAIAALSTMTGWASAAATAIDIFHVVGVPGSGGATSIQGPCYCDQTAYFSPVMLLKPGTYNFGHVQEHWVLSSVTPDGGDNQPNFWLLFEPMEVSGAYPFSFPGLIPYAYPDSGVCLVDDDACNTAYATATVDFDLLYTVYPGENAIQVGLIASYVYTSALPEPMNGLMLGVGLACLVGLSRRQAARRHLAAATVWHPETSRQQA